MQILNVSNIVQKNIVHTNIVDKDIVDKNIVHILNRYENFEYTKPKCGTLEEWLRNSLLVSKMPYNGQADKKNTYDLNYTFTFTVRRPFNKKRQNR